MKIGRIAFSAAFLVLVSIPGPSLADETVTYSYDALGRLIRTVRAGGPASGVDAQIQYDPAGNRAKLTVSGAASSAAPVRVIVVPLNGYTIIAVPLG
jgi:YD repeat-containing protein